jgi:putative ABC transport system permease protein
VVRDLFNGKNPVGSFIKINRNNFLVIGSFEEKGSSSWRDEDNLIIMPYTTVQKKLTGDDALNVIVLKVKEESQMDNAEKETAKIMKRAHRISERDEPDYRIESQKEMIKTVEETTKTFTFLLVGIACISLLVGGIGIMNIMLVSVMERIKEIGVRKSVGANKSDILSQFLTESVMVCLFGGAVGVILGIFLAKMISSLAQLPEVIPVYGIVLSLTFSVTIGVFFGLYPAYKASLMNPIDALRSE